jgi:hypothetical protein
LYSVHRILPFANDAFGVTVIHTDFLKRAVVSGRCLLPHASTAFAIIGEKAYISNSRPSFLPDRHPL